MTLKITQMFNNSMRFKDNFRACHHLSLSQFYTRETIISGQLEDETVWKAARGPIRAKSFSTVYRIGVMAMDPWHFAAALYAYTGAASTGLVGVPARGTDANRHGSPMAGRVPLDWDTVDDSKWHSVLCILFLPQPLSLALSLMFHEIDLCFYLLPPIILSQSLRHFASRRKDILIFPARNNLFHINCAHLLHCIKFSCNY